MVRLTPFEQCRRDFARLTAPVNNDSLTQTTVADLVFAALHELDLHQEGELALPLTRGQVAQLERFLAKWHRPPGGSQDEPPTSSSA